MTTILLIRHALNDYVSQKKLAGWLPGIHLNEKGRAQAEALAASLGEFKVTGLYASPLERAVETAAPIGERQGLEVVERPGLGEVRYGRWQGRTLKSLRKLKSWSIIQHTPSLASFPEGESFPQAQARIVAELEVLRKQHSSKNDVIACVSHSDIIKLAIAHFLGLPLDLFQRLTVSPASVSMLSVGKAHSRLVVLNDTHAARSASSG